METMTRLTRHPHSRRAVGLAAAAHGVSRLFRGLPTAKAPWKKQP